MSRALTLACMFSFALAVSLAGQAGTAPKTTIVTDEDYATAMKEIGPTSQALGKAIASADDAGAAKAAARLEVLFTDVHGYWAGKKIEDASTAAQDAVAGLQAVQKAVAAKDMTAAEAGRQKVQAACKVCHSAHREKTPEGGWRIK
jgi:cytochrome c556